MRKTWLVVLITGTFIFAIVAIFTFTKIHHQVEDITTIAVTAYRLDAIGSLTKLIESENHSYEEKNSAIWALGQLADQEALPFLEQLNTQTKEKSPCNRNSGLCKGEIEKAMKWCRNGNLTSWMYRHIE
ncbi:MAG: HEAT repeat domain-containing protein [Saprospiraceae bacterium]|nr:HEAT repeat domain-containing protein [Saprospiraceae bacterium]